MPLGKSSSAFKHTLPVTPEGVLDAWVMHSHQLAEQMKPQPSASLRLTGVISMGVWVCTMAETKELYMHTSIIVYFVAGHIVSAIMNNVIAHCSFSSNLAGWQMDIEKIISQCHTELKITKHWSVVGKDLMGEENIPFCGEATQPVGETGDRNYGIKRGL